MEREDSPTPTNDYAGLADRLAEQFSQHIESNPDARSWQTTWIPDGEELPSVYKLAREILEEMYLHIDFELIDDGPVCHLRAKRIPL